MYSVRAPSNDLSATKPWKYVNSKFEKFNRFLIYIPGGNVVNCGSCRLPESSSRPTESSEITLIPSFFPVPLSFNEIFDCWSKEDLSLLPFKLAAAKYVN